MLIAHLKFAQKFTELKLLWLLQQELLLRKQLII